LDRVVLVTLDLGNAHPGVPACRFWPRRGAAHAGVGSMVSEAATGQPMVGRDLPRPGDLTVVIGFNFVGDGIRDGSIACPRREAPAAAAAMTVEPILSVEDLRVWFYTDTDVVRAVDGVSFELRPAKLWASSASPAP